MLQRTLETVRAAVHDAVALVSPVDCAGCHLPDRTVCNSCLARLEPRVTRRELAGGSPAFAGLRYGREVRSVILEFKEGGRTDLARAISPALSAAVDQALATVAQHAGRSLVVVPVPPGRRALRRRGYDPVALLLRRAGIRSFPALRMTGGRVSQKTLDVASRAANRVGAMRAVRSLDGRDVVIVDDIVTSGATLAEASRAVREAGGRVVALAAAASTPKLVVRSVSVR